MAGTGTAHLRPEDEVLLRVEDLVGPEPKPAAKRGPAPKLQQQMDRIAKLPRTRQRFVMDVLDSMLAQTGR